MSYHAITFLVLLTAAALYFAGSAGGSAVLFAGGVVLETWLWVRLLRGRRGSP